MHAVRWLASPRQGEKALLNDFWYFWSHKSTIKKSFFMILLSQSSFRGRTMFAPTMRVVEGIDTYAERVCRRRRDRSRAVATGV